MAQGLDALLSSLKIAADHKRFRAIDFFEPYPKQREFFEAGFTKRERLFRAGNQLGKTYAGAAEMSYHLTGDYPPDWPGRKFTHPVKAWCAGVKSTLVRDGPQMLLCGTPGVTSAFGTGLIPRDAFADKPSLSRGVTDAYDTIQVRHKTGGVSTLTFKSYEEGREKFQSTSLDVIWCDEEPPMDVYTECLARIAATGGMIYITFTPLKGKSVVVTRFMAASHPDRADIVMTVFDAKHMTPEKIRLATEGYPSWQRESRLMGTPMQGVGRVFPVDEATIGEDILPVTLIPPDWTKLWGIDFGIGHPFAAVLSLWDKDNDVIHIRSAIRMADALPLQHASAMKAIGEMVKVAYPKDGSDREKSTGQALSDSYKQHGLYMLDEYAKWPDGSISTEQGITEMHERMLTNRFKVSKTLLQGDWGDEFRNYHRNDEGLIVKVGDDLMSATRICMMAKRFGTKAILGYSGRRSSEPTREFAEGLDFNPWTGR